MEFNFCPQCGCKVTPEYNFCPQCGVKLPREAKTDFDKQVEDFFQELENATPEDRDEFFKLIEQDLRKKKGEK